MRHEGAAKLYELIKDIEVAMMTTIGGGSEFRPGSQEAATARRLPSADQVALGKRDQLHRDEIMSQSQPKNSRMCSKVSRGQSRATAGTW